MTGIPFTSTLRRFVGLFRRLGGELDLVLVFVAGIFPYMYQWLWYECSIYLGKSFESSLKPSQTADGRNPAPVDRLSHHLQGFIHPRWCRIFSRDCLIQWQDWIASQLHWLLLNSKWHCNLQLCSVFVFFCKYTSQVRFLRLKSSFGPQKNTLDCIVTIGLVTFLTGFFWGGPTIYARTMAKIATHDTTPSITASNVCLGTQKTQRTAPGGRLVVMWFWVVRTPRMLRLAPLEMAENIWVSLGLFARTLMNSELFSPYFPNWFF